MFIQNQLTLSPRPNLMQKIRNLFSAGEPTAPREAGGWLGTEWRNESNPPPPRNPHGHWIASRDQWYWKDDEQAADGPDGVATSPSTTPAPQISWHKSLSINGAPIVTSGRLFASDRYPEKALHAFDPATGEELWKRSFANASKNDHSSAGPLGPVVAPDGALLVAGDDGQLHSVDPLSGHDNWTLPVNDFESNITVYQDGRASFCSEGQVVNVDLNRHQVISRTPLSTVEVANFESAPVVGKDGTVFGGGHDGRLYSLEPETGAIKWTRDTGKMIRNSPTLGPDDTLYVASIGEHLHAIDSNTGQEKWRVQTNGGVDSPSLSRDGATVFVGSADNYTYAIDAASGKEKWKAYCGADVQVAPLPTDSGMLYVATDNNHLLCLDQATGIKQWDLQAPSYMHNACAADEKGHVFLGVNNGQFYSLK